MRSLLIQNLRLALLPLVLSIAAPLLAVDLPSGTPITFSLDSTVSSRSAQVGDQVACTLSEPLRVDGRELAPRGAPLRARVTFVRQSGRLHDAGYLTLRLESIEVDGRRYQLHSTAIRDKGDSHTGSNITKIGGGAGIGTLIGALAGGGKGALLGGLIGAGGGTGYAAATGKRPAAFDAESVHTVTLERQAEPR